MARALLGVCIFWAVMGILAGGCGLTDCEPYRKVCYLDDMEAIALVKTFPVARDAWVTASVPEGYRWQDDRRIWWYVKDREVRREDLFPQSEAEHGESYIPVMEVDFRGARYPGGGYASEDQWSGLMRLVSASGQDCSDLTCFQVWLRRKQGSGGKIHIDFGDISENFYNPWADSLHTEDRDGDGELGSDENTGLDGVLTGHPGDDPYDDWAFAEGDYSCINGTEGNPGTSPDTEDLDGDGLLDTEDVHFRLTIDLQASTYVVRVSDDWRLLRIPLACAEKYGGDPSWDSIRYVRFFFTGTDSPAVYQVAYPELVGTAWENEGVRNYWDMSPVTRQPGVVFWISAKNTRDDPDYIPPYDPGKDGQGYRKHEQSMVLLLAGEDRWHCGAAHKSLDRVEDITLYDSLTFYVHGTKVATLPRIMVFVRIGSDSLNFYEHATRSLYVVPGWNRVSVDLDEFRTVEGYVPLDWVIYGHTVARRATETLTGFIWMFGEPSLAEISWIGAGVVFMEIAPGMSIREVWLDDLRVTATR